MLSNVLLAFLGFVGVIAATLPPLLLTVGPSHTDTSNLLFNFPVVAPGGSTTVYFNASKVPAPVTVNNLTLSIADNNVGWSVSNNSFSGTITNGTVFSVILGAPNNISVQTITFSASLNGVAEIVGSVTVEVTCSNGILCDGEERYVNGSCAVPVSPFCDLGTSCTNTNCNEAVGVCSISLAQPSCEACIKNCEDYVGCGNKVCGTDGCGGNCGTCSGDLYCNGAGECVSVNISGVCSNPIPLFVGSKNLTGVHNIAGNSSIGYHHHVIPCNIFSTSPELVYSFTVPVGQRYGFDFRSSGFDTVMDVRENSCDGKYIGCNDDGTPPGNYGSRVARMIGPGNYVVVVKGYSDSEQGEFNLYMSFQPDCIPKCNSQYCGDDECGGTCGTCGDGEFCDANFKCQLMNCVPECNGRFCGLDGCGGLCGNCTDNLLCDIETGQCNYYYPCDGLNPDCGGCNSTQFCSSNCTCIDLDAPLPDLYVDRDKLAADILFDSDTFKESSCAYREGCILGTGLRRMLRFSVLTSNQGRHEIALPDPSTRPDLFTWSPCHGHFHFNDYAYYALLTTNGTTVVEHGRKQGYCVLDGSRITNGTVGCKGSFDCSRQGISVGWADTYTFDLDCQWIDITNVSAGNYLLYVELNRPRKIVESSYSNNKAWVPVTIPPWDQSSSSSDEPVSTTTTGGQTTGKTSDAGIISKVASIWLFVFVVVFVL